MLTFLRGRAPRSVQDHSLVAPLLWQKLNERGSDATLSMMFSNASRSSLCYFVVPRNLQFNRLSGISFLTASILSSSLIVPNMFSNSFVSLMNVLKMSSNYPRYLALSCSEMLLISAASAEFLTVPLVVSHCNRVPRFESVLLFCLLHYSQWFVCCCSVQYLVK